MQLNILFILDSAQTQPLTAFDQHVSIKMADSFNDFLTFMHSRAGSQRNGIALLPRLEEGMRFMSIAPRRTAINECLELRWDVCPIGRRHAKHHIRPVELFDNPVHIIRLNAFCRAVASPASLAESKSEIIDTDAARFTAVRKAFRCNRSNFCRRTIAHRTAVHNQSSHSDASILYTTQAAANALQLVFFIQFIEPATYAGGLQVGQI